MQNEKIEVRRPGSNQRTDTNIAKAVMDTIVWHIYQLSVFSCRRISMVLHRV